MSHDDADGPPRAMLIAALVFAVGAVASVLAIAAARQHSQRVVTIAAVAAPYAADPACQTLLAALPSRLGDYRRAALGPPAPDGAAAWAGTGEPVVLRCGLDRPAEFVTGSPLQFVDDVQWFAVRDDERSTWYAVDRPVYIALTLPPGSGPAPIQQISELVDETTAAVPISPAAPR